MGQEEEDEIEDYSQHLAYRMVGRIFPLWPRLHGHSFLISKQEVDAELAKPENKDTQIGGKAGKAAFYATPLMLCLAVVELSDVMFAILGLRTLYFVLEGMKRYLVHLEKAVIVLLF